MAKPTVKEIAQPVKQETPQSDLDDLNYQEMVQLVTNDQLFPPRFLYYTAPTNFIEPSTPSMALPGPPLVPPQPNNYSISQPHYNQPY